MAARSDRCGWLFAILPGLLVAGCGGPDDGIKVYKVATVPSKGPVIEDTGPPVEAGPPKIRFLGAVVPTGDGQSYFVRFLGPVAEIDAHEKEFDAFLNSIRVPGDGGKPISWTAPAGWRESPASNTRVVNFIVVPAAGPQDKPLEAYISVPFGGDLLSNVNRWRTDFVGLPKTTAAELPTMTKEVQLGATKGHRVDLRGPGAKKGAMPPFMGGGN